MLAHLSPIAPVATPAAPDALQRAWSLKDACYAAWNSEPQQAVQAAAALRELCSAVPQAGVMLRQELEALAAWTDGIAQVTQGRMEAACAGFDRAETLFRLLGQGEKAAETQVPKIMALTILGRHVDAAECAERIEREFVAHGNARAAAKVALNLGSLKMRRDAYAEAARHYRDAAVRFARAGDREHSVMADIGLADALTALGRFDDAERMFARARMRSGTHGLPVPAALVDESQALLDLVRGRYREALAGFERSRRCYETLGMPQHLAIAEKQLGDAYLELRLLPEALALLERAVARFAELEMPDDQAWALVQRGRALAQLRRTSQAIESLRDAGGLFAAQANSVGAAAVALEHAELALAAGELDLALDLATSAARDFGAAASATGQARADTVAAEALLQAQRVEEAGARFAAVLGRSRTQQLLPVQVRALTGQGLVAQASGSREAAQTAFEQAIALFEEQRRALPGDEFRSAFLADHLRPYEELLRLSVQQARAGDAGDAAAVLRRLDRFRARALADRLQHGGVRTADPEIDALRAQLNWLYRRQQRQDADAGSSNTLQELIQRSERELLERSRRHRLTGDSPSADASGALDVAALQAALGAADAVVVYGVVDDELLACIARKSGITLHRQLAAWSETTSALRSLRFQLDSLRMGSAPVAAHLPLLARRAQARLEQVQRLVWAPLARDLATCRRVLVVPHGALASVPFAALHDGREALVQRHEMALAPSAHVALLGLQREARAVQRVCALGASAQLPHAATEARSVAAMFAGGQSHVGAEATLAALRSAAAGADLLHLACHAQFRDDNPMFSAMHLADGLLTAEAVEALHLQASTVVLSACDTGLSGSDAGGDRLGLVRAFLVAGAARVLASLWPVDDAVTEGFMRSFYTALRQGQGTAAALRSAQLQLLRDQPHPFFWAAFTLHGGW